MDNFLTGKELKAFEKHGFMGAFDEKDPRDWNPEKLFGADIPKRITQSSTVDLHSVYARKQTVNSCSSQGLSRVIEIQLRLGADFEDKLDNFRGNIDAKTEILWERQHIKGQIAQGTATERGDYLTNALKTAKEFGIPVLMGRKIINVKIKGYARITDDEVFYWMQRGRPVYTGWDWVMQRVDGKLRSYDEDGYLFMDGSSIGGHVNTIVRAYNNGDFGSLNSWGQRWGPLRDGTALATKAKVDDSFSKYIVDLDWDGIRSQLN